MRPYTSCDEARRIAFGFAPPDDSYFATRLRDGLGERGTRPGMENEADLIGKRRTAAGAIGGKLCLMQLDQILGLAARAIQAVVDPLGRADIEAGDDEADVEAEHRRLNTADGAPFAIPGLCLVARLGIAAQNSQVLDGASRADSRSLSRNLREKTTKPCHPQPRPMKPRIFISARSFGLNDDRP